MMFAGLFILFFVLRLLPIFTAIERVYHYDELNLGFITAQWLKHQSASLLDYQFDSYGGESLVLGLLSILFVKLLGPTLLATKLSSFVFVLATFGLMLAFIHRFFGRQKALLAGLLMALCHPAYVQLSLSGMTGHTESLLFAAAMLFFFYFFLYSPYRGLPVFLSGVCGGIAFWIYNENVIMVLLCLSCWLVLDRRSLLSRFFFFFTAGLALGLAPWFLYNIHEEAKGAAFLANSFETVLNLLRDWRFLLKKTLTLFSAGIPFSFAHFPALGIHERVLSTAYFALAYLPLLPFAAGKMFQTLKTGKDPDRIFPLLLFPLVFTAFFIFSPFDIAYDIGYAGFRYLSPLHLFLLPLPALLLPAGKLKKILTPAVLILGLLGQTSLFFKEPFARAQSYNANSYYQMGTTLRFLLWPKLKTIEDVQKELKKYEPAERVYFLWGMVDAAMSDGDKALLAGSSIYADEVSAAFTGPSYFFLDEWKKSLLPDSENFMIRKINPANFRASWDSNILIGRSFQNLLDNASPQNRPALFREIGWIANAMYREDRKRALNVLLENVPADGKEEALRGFLAFDENYGINRN